MWPLASGWKRAELGDGQVWTRERSALTVVLIDRDEILQSIDQNGDRDEEKREQLSQ